MQSSMAVRLRSPATGTAAPHSCRPAVVRLHSAHRLLVNRQIAVQPTRASAKEEFEAELATESMDSNILDYCSLDPQGKRPTVRKSLGEKEQEYLDALRAFYYDGKPTMSDEEFENLEQELLWEGSRVAILSSTEQKFMEASRAFEKGQPILSDEQYDDLKKQLRRDRSTVVAQGPRCSIRSKSMYSDLTVDYLKVTLLNAPAVLLVLGLLFSIDDITGFEITKVIELPKPYGIVFLWGLVLPSLFILANAITSLVFKDALILKGTCPECNTENFTYFGDILTVSGSRSETTTPCKECKAQLKFKADDRMLVVVPKGDDGGDKKGKKAPKKDPEPATA